VALDGSATTDFLGKKRVNLLIWWCLGLASHLAVDLYLEIGVASTCLETKLLDDGIEV
jgi:hypothetical protein